MILFRVELVFFVAYFLLNENILCGNFNINDRAETGESINNFIIFELDRNVTNYDCSIVIVFISQFFSSLEFNLLIFDPEVSELVFQGFDLSRVGNFDNSISISIAVKGLRKACTKDFNILSLANFQYFFLCHRVRQVKQNEFVCIDSIVHAWSDALCHLIKGMILH